MVKKILRRWAPDREKLEANAFLRCFGHWFADPRLWHINRRSVARSVAAGAIGGLVPGPLQMITAALLALIFRCNVPVAILITLYSNPLTIGPLYWLAYQLGNLVLQVNGREDLPALPALQDHALSEWLSLLLEWTWSLGWPLAVGLPLLGTILAVTGYLLTDWGWRIHVRRECMRRSKIRKKSIPFQ